MQFSGYLATQQNAAPPLIVQATHAVRDLRATLSQAATGYIILIDILQNGILYSSLSVPSGQTTSASVVDRVNLPPLTESATLTMNLALQVIPGFAGSLSPGRDLTVTIRF